MDSSIIWGVGTAFCLLLGYGLKTNPNIGKWVDDWEDDDDEDEIEETPRTKKSTLKPKQGSSQSYERRDGGWVER